MKLAITTLPAFDSIKAVAEAGLPVTFSEETAKHYESFLNSPWGFQPVEAMWMNTGTKVDPKTLKETPVRSPYKLGYYCIRAFNSNYTNPTDAFLIRVTNKEGRPEIVSRFYSYLFGKESPWKDILPAIVQLRPDKNGIPEALFLYRNDFGCAKLFMSLMTAMRLHTCWGLDVVFTRLVDLGFTEEEAILLSTNFSWAGQSITVSNGPAELHTLNPEKSLSLSKFGVSKTDMPFLTNHSPDGFKPLLVDKRPNSTHKTIAEREPSQPNSFLWNTSTEEVNADSLPSSFLGKGKLQVDKSKTTPLEVYLSGGAKPSADYVIELKGKLLGNEKIAL